LRSRATADNVKFQPAIKRYKQTLKCGILYANKFNLQIIISSTVYQQTTNQMNVKETLKSTSIKFSAKRSMSPKE